MSTSTRALRVHTRRLILVLAALATSSCGGDDGTGPGGSGGDLFMRLRVNGTLYEYSQPTGLGNDYASGSPSADATIVITEFSATHVAGTFFGVLHETGLADLTVTEGAFRVARFN